MHQINGHGSSADRVQFPDSHGDMWVFTLVAYKHYPALGDGSFTFFCLQPGVSDWSAVKPQDFQADAELSRLIPALKFMATEFRRGPTLPEIAREVQLSPFHFHRRFTELLGLTPKEFMSDCQIHECKTELLGGEKELAENGRVVVGNLSSTGMRPTFLYKFERRGVPLPGALFHEAPRQAPAVGVLS